jgi:Arc/MetJ-type ribon-helix-helix transcriptional regulator
LADQNLRDNEKKSRSRCPPYTSKIIKAGALLADTKTLLSHWDMRASIRENLDRMRRENIFGKASRSRMNHSRLPADLEKLLERELPAGEYRSEAELVADAVRLLRECHKSHEAPLKNGTMHVPIWEVFEETLKDIHEGELDHLLHRAAEQPDHSINGTPQKPS